MNLFDYVRKADAGKQKALGLYLISALVSVYADSLIKGAQWAENEHIVNYSIVVLLLMCMKWLKKLIPMK